MTVIGTGNWHFPALGFCFLGRLILSCCVSDLLRFLGRGDPTPFVGAISGQTLSVSIGQAEQVGCAVLGVACPAVDGYHKEAKRFRFSNPGRDRMAMNAVLMELIERDRKLAVVVTAVVGMFNLDPVKHATA
ncbi:hypothetical protein J2W51_002355 [Tardiphaga robiniae]|uniref:hypothetical protein n=1 Tax=Tardiphaga robiniae TaxID=943830 RepID=UPI0028580CCC|nr:hypothetical protein [Tardiphaga robiniae]MDR6659785.1 hypothetical protein [Tardiphaga robiniae]